MSLTGTYNWTEIHMDVHPVCFDMSKWRLQQPAVLTNHQSANYLC
jgi:hypothetical protein